MHKKVNNEQKAREHLESQVKELKNSIPSKSQNRISEAELDVLKNKLKQAEAAANETPVMLLNLQSEMSSMKKKHRNAILEVEKFHNEFSNFVLSFTHVSFTLQEQRRAALAEQEAKALAASHEARVAGLEARLAELSDIVGGYDRLRQQDQKSIHKLKDQLITFQNNKKSDSYDNPQQLAEKIKSLYFQLVELDKSSTNVKGNLQLLKSNSF